MAKVKQSHVVNEADLVEYLESSSDFAFELRCVELLNGLRERDEEQIFHGGFYVDPVTGKDRQFDIRVPEKKAKDSPNLCWLAIECKNLQPSFPLLVSCVPRDFSEAYLHALRAQYVDSEMTCTVANYMQRAYRPDQPVGKERRQVGRHDQNGTLVTSDSEVFEKWSQALASADGMFHDAVNFIRADDPTWAPYTALILPILVLPDETLWTVEFSADGSRKGAPKKSNRCSYYVGKEYSRGGMEDVNLKISHLEIVTFTGLQELVSEIAEKDGDWFPQIR